MRVALVFCCVLGALPATAQPTCLLEAQRLTQVSGSTHDAFLVAGEGATFAVGSTGQRCIGAVAVGPMNARLQVTLLADTGEALASSDEHANSAYVLHCGFDGELHVFVEMLRGAGEVHVSASATGGNQRREWEARSGGCFSPPVGASAPSLEADPEAAPRFEDLAAAISEPWIRRGWALVGTFQGNQGRITADGCLRIFGLSGAQVEVPSIQRRASSLSFCLSGAGSFELRMDPPDGHAVVLRHAQFESPPAIPGVLWSEARAQGTLTRRARVHGSGGESWENTHRFNGGCHRVVAFGRGAILSVQGEGEPIRQRRVEGWSQVLFCGEGEWRMKLRFFSEASDVRLFVGDL